MDVDIVTVTDINLEIEPCPKDCECCEIVVEDLINECDICVGTSSSALIRQSIYLDKPVIQMFHNYSYMAKLNNYYSVDSYHAFKTAINDVILNKNKFRFSGKLIINKKINPIIKIENYFK